MIIHVVGNRPQFVKLAVLHKEISKQQLSAQFIIHTGQHFSALMSDIFFDELDIPAPDVQLKIRSASRDGYISETAKAIAEVLSQKPPDAKVVVYGDTNSTLAAALAAAAKGNFLLHFESGVRTADKQMPEELNRLHTDRLSDVHFCCTELNRQNLMDEGYGTAGVRLSGDLMLDAFCKIAPSKKNVTDSRDYVACTIHRSANITDRSNLCEIVSAINEIHRDREVIIPVHPHTEKQLLAFGLELKCSVLKPLGYREMKRFIAGADTVITDSGGTSREAFFSSKRSLILMKYPFWPEILTAGGAKNASPVKKDILEKFRELDTLQPDFNSAIFGDGNAAVKICAYLHSLLPR